MKKKSIDYASSFSELRIESNYDYPDQYYTIRL